MACRAITRNSIICFCIEGLSYYNHSFLNPRLKLSDSAFQFLHLKLFYLFWPWSCSTWKEPWQCRRSSVFRWTELQISCIISSGWPWFEHCLVLALQKWTGEDFKDVPIHRCSLQVKEVSLLSACCLLQLCLSTLWEKKPLKCYDSSFKPRKMVVAFRSWVIQSFFQLPIHRHGRASVTINPHIWLQKNLYNRLRPSK